MKLKMSILLLILIGGLVVTAKSENVIIAVWVDDETGYFTDNKGNRLFGKQFETVYPFSEGLAGVVLNGKHGFIDKQGKQVILCKYDYCNPFQNGLATVRLDGNWGVINKAGKEIIPCCRAEYVDWSVVE